MIHSHIHFLEFPIFKESAAVIQQKHVYCMLHSYNLDSERNRAISFPVLYVIVSRGTRDVGYEESYPNKQATFNRTFDVS